MAVGVEQALGMKNTFILDSPARPQSSPEALVLFPVVGVRSCNLILLDSLIVIFNFLIY